MKTSTMFLQNITVIDHAIIDEKGAPVGGSYNLSVEVEGELDPKEQVVVDFGTIKKLIKDLIDNSKYAIDHRLVVLNGFSKYGTYTDGLETPLMTVSGQTDYITCIPFVKSIIGSFELYLKIMLEANLSKFGVTKITPFLDDDFILPKESKLYSHFRYVHGLKSSTSYGCQNIAHGHRSFIATDFGTVSAYDRGEIGNLMDEMAEDMSGVLIFEDNLVGPGVIDYTCQRGDFKMVLDESVKHETFTHETTVENLLGHAQLVYGRRLKKLGVTKLWISEGLCKGASVVL